MDMQQFHYTGEILLIWISSLLVHKSNLSEKAVLSRDSLQQTRELNDYHLNEVWKKKSV